MIFLKRKRERLIFLHQIDSITRRTLRKMLQFNPSLEKIFTLSPHELSYRLAIPLKRATSIYFDIRDKATINLYKNNLSNIQTVTIFDQHYPEQLKHIYDPPLVLYCIGNIDLLHTRPAISVIGTRKPSNEGPQKLHFILAPLIYHEWTIVSGLAYGIDRYAHEITLKYNGNTIAVLGSGFHHLYPVAHKELFDKITKEGLVITEYPPHVRARKHHFPERNRIVSGLTGATLVIEAEERSGTNITVELALEQGREVYAVPGSIFCAKTKGCHKMIQEGAKLVMSAQDILEDYEQMTLF